jgi:hypothetical protein
LCSYSDSLAGLDEGDFGPDAKSFANNFCVFLVYVPEIQSGIMTMANAEWEVLFSPATTYCMNITCAYSTGLNLYIDVIVAEWFWLELILVEFKPSLRPIHLKACECVRITHCKQLAVYTNRELLRKELEIKTKRTSDETFQGN